MRRSPDPDHPDSKTVYLLAMAQSAALQYQEAIATMKRAQLLNSSSANPSRQLGIDILNQLGRVYTQVGDNSAAIASYTDSLGMDPAQRDIYLRKADAVFPSSPVQAIRVLLDGLPHDPTSSEIRVAMREDISKLKPANREPVAEILQAALPKLPVAEEYAEVCGYAAADLLYTDRDRAIIYLQRVAALRQEDLAPVTRNWVARIQAGDYWQQGEYEKAYNATLAAQKIFDDSITQAQLSDIEVAWAESQKESNPAKARELFKRAYTRSKPLVIHGKEEAYDSFAKAGHMLDQDEASREVFAQLVKTTPDDTNAARALFLICNDYLLDLQCTYSTAKKILATPPGDIGLQLDGVEAAVLTGNYAQAQQWLALADKHTETDLMHKAVANFYRFWIAFAQDSLSSKQDFQHLVTSLGSYKKSRAATPLQFEPWWFKGARHALDSSTLPPAKKDVLLKIIASFDDPGQDTTVLIQLVQQM